MIRALVLAALAAAASGCGIDNRSQGYRCNPGCPDDRTCIDGWCVLSEDVDAGIDAPTDAPADAFVCPAACTSCLGMVCIIDCSAPGSCPTRVQCPTGLDCSVECDGDGACANGVTCTGAGDCDVDCGGPGSCGGRVTCGTGRCDVKCEGPDACEAGIDCSDACRCDTDCAPTACDVNPMCPLSAACVTGDGDCTSGPGVCDQC